MSLQRRALSNATTRPAAPLRIFALPLAQTPHDPRKPLVYWHVNQHAPHAAKDATVKLNVREPASWVPYGIDKASAFWLSWGEAPRVAEGKIEWSERVKGWKYWVWRNGERLMDKIECEE